MSTNDALTTLPIPEEPILPHTIVTESSLSKEDMSSGPSLYQDDVRRNYSTLIGIAQTLEAEDARDEAGFYVRHLGETVARFVEQIVWADQKIDVSETEAIALLIEVDAVQGGWLAECLRNPCGELSDLHLLPEFLKACVVHDAVHSSQLAATALDAFESLGLDLMASDREIAEEEVELFQGVLGSWRRASASEPNSLA